MNRLSGRLILSAQIAFAAVSFAGSAHARIDRFEVVRIEPAFGNTAFDGTGTYERVIAKAYGSLDPQAGVSASIRDIGLAPRNAAGRVEYVSDVEILRPSQRAKANGMLFFNILNRGNKGGHSLFNADVPGNLTRINNLDDAGDGFMQRQGYTMVWFGWQGDVLPGNNRMLLKVPVARQPDGSPVTGTVRSELVTQAPVTTLNLSQGWFTAASHAPYPVVETDNRKAFADGVVPTLTVRMRGQAAPMLIPAADWSFGACLQGGAATRSHADLPAFRLQTRADLRTDLSGT